MVALLALAVIAGKNFSRSLLLTSVQKEPIPLPIKRPEHVETLKQRILLLAIYVRRRDKPFEDGKSC